MILYPTETLYALGVDVFDTAEMDKLFQLKGRDSFKAVSWLVRDVSDIQNYAEMSDLALQVAAAFLPGQLTLVLPAKDNIPKECLAADGTVAFRISADHMAQKIVADFMDKHNAPLSCTSANVSGLPTMYTVTDILKQFGPASKAIDNINDDGLRSGLASTIVRVVGEDMTIIREGEITEAFMRARLGL